MTKDDITRWAQKAGLHSAVLLHIYGGREAALTDSERDELGRIERFASLVAAAEREAVIAEAIEQGFVSEPYAEQFRAAIRARGNT